MKLTIQIEMDNAAFEDDMELPRIMMNVTQAITKSTVQITDGGWIRDSNGNTVGAWRIS